ncbi:hypothetical protein MILUP08_41934 [Micromonospora lupini str. Lupac 08]|uniref:Uncharacterized protein n=1 Tax=Micromonospora lupini str. Lupac 08 TaxID=1150864 RepID=I0KZL8_9ACTN|nr:hypothetical protein MILUP08_41934 [Micromonospora lupini str. Lupac 08]
MRRGDAPQRLVDAYDRRARLGVDLSVADGPVARTSAAPALNLLTDPYRIKRHASGWDHAARALFGGRAGTGRASLTRRRTRRARAPPARRQAGLEPTDGSTAMRGLETFPPIRTRAFEDPTAHADRQPWHRRPRRRR